MYKIVFTKKAQKQFYKLNRDVQKRLTKAIDEKLILDPKKHLVPLMGDRAGFYKFRVGDYRFLCTKNENKFMILVVKIKHRKEVYKD